MPKLSIITINYNNLAGLQKTMQSVFEQTFTDYEYIIIDGGSADGSKEFIQEYKDKLTYWVSEKDNGVYNAMNKGIAKATGEYFYFLNSGDVLYEPGTLTDMMKYCKEDIVFGDLLLDKKTGYEELIWPDELPFSFFLTGINSIPHQAAFMSQNIFKKTGKYLEDKKIVSDWAHFLLAINRDGFSYRHIKQFVCIYNLDGISAQESNLPLVMSERRQVIEKYFPTFIRDYDRLFYLEDSWGRLHKRKLFKAYVFFKSFFMPTTKP